MPITSSAKKALRASKKKRSYNLARKDALATTMKAVKIFVAQKKAKEALAALPAAYQALDKAAKTHLIPANTAARKKSRLAAMIKKLG